MYIKNNHSILYNIFCRLVLILAIFFSFSAFAAVKKIKKMPCNPVFPQASLVVDMNTGKVLHAQNATGKVYPASLTKLMSLYLTFEAIESGKLPLNKKLYVSRRAERMLPTKLGLKAGETITVKDAMLGLIVKSANDASVALAEAIAGSEEKFATLMNFKAHSLGMKNTFFYNASGWHHPMQVTTALDMVKLAIALKRDYPRFYPLFSRTSFEFRGKTVKGHNRVVANYIGAEGLKTGFTCPSGFNLITSASRGDKALVGIVTSNKTASARDKKMVTLLDQHFGVVQPVKIKKKIPTMRVSSAAKQKKRNLAST